MINLLPPELKQSYTYARQNSALVKIISAFGFGIGGLVLLVVAGFVYMQQAANNYRDQAAAIEASLRRQDQVEVEKQAQNVSSSLKLAVQVLSKEILFSQLIQRLAIITPNNVNLSNIHINDLQGGLDITAAALDYNAATQLQVNLADPANKIFSKADIVSISCTGSDTQKYPCTVTIRALFTDDNSFLFINGKAVNSR